MTMRHYTHRPLLDSSHRTGVLLAGVGGTGSAVLLGLARMDAALRGLGLRGLHVTAMDPDDVEEPNLGRQPFSPQDVGRNKAEVLVSRINRYFGLDWQAVPRFWPTGVIGDTDQDWWLRRLDMVIGCVDSGPARKTILGGLEWRKASPLYWLDFGNGADHGQVVLGLSGRAPQPESSHETIEFLPTVLELFPEAGAPGGDDGPSCTMAAALGAQDLYINGLMAHLGLHLLWRLLRVGVIEIHGAVASLDGLSVSPIRVDREAWARMGWKQS